MEDNIYLWVILGVVVGVPGAIWATMQIKSRFRRPLEPGSNLDTNTKYPAFFHRINQVFESKVQLCRLLTQEPKLEDGGMQKPDKQVLDFVNQKVLSYNEPQAILDPLPHWVDDPPVWRIKKLKYAVAAAMRDMKQQPSVLSANAVVFNDEKKAIYLQRREAVAEYYTHKLHTFGGAFVSDIEGDTAEHDHSSLIRTAKREVLFESNMLTTWDNGPMVVSREVSTGYIQLVLMGAAVTVEQVNGMHGNEEGHPIEVKYSELQDWMLDMTEQWVPAGLAHVLCWLALGVPGSDDICWNDIMKPKDIYGYVMDRIDHNKIVL